MTAICAAWTTLISGFPSTSRIIQLNDALVRSSAAPPSSSSVPSISQASPARISMSSCIVSGKRESPYNEGAGPDLACEVEGQGRAGAQAKPSGRGLRSNSESLDAASGGNIDARSSTADQSGAGSTPGEHRTIAAATDEYS